MDEWSYGWNWRLRGKVNQEFFGHIGRHSFLHGVQFFSVDSGVTDGFAGHLERLFANKSWFLFDEFNCFHERGKLLALKTALLLDLGFRILRTSIRLA